VSALAPAARRRADPPPRRGESGHLAVSVWVRLLKAHGLVLRELRRRAPERLTLPQFDVLVQLYRRPHGMTSRELTRELLVTAGNVTGLVDRLHGLGLVERRPVPEDRRAARIVLTALGRGVARRAIPRHRRDVEALLAPLAPRDLARLRRLLGRLSRSLEEAQP
jgi:DNA-binding MarR family transcriptional regulator